MKYKQRFRNWLWEKVREPKAMMKYHPDKIQELIDDDMDISSDEFNMLITQ
jgi:hypothetical protein